MFVVLFVGGNETPAVVLFAVAAWTDFFDGLIARRFDQVSELGKLLDPLADRVFIVALAVVLVARAALPLWLAITIVARDLLLLSAFPILERRKVERIEVNFVGKTATAALLFGLTWLAGSFVVEAMGKQVGVILVIVGAALYWAAALLYARTARVRLKALTEKRA